MAGKRYEWNDQVIGRRGASLVARAWGLFCPARTKLGFALDPVAYLDWMRLVVALVIGVLGGLAVSLVFMVVLKMTLFWGAVVFCLVCCGAGAGYVLLGAGKAWPMDVNLVMGELFSEGERYGHHATVLAQRCNRVWELEIMSQVAGQANQARLEEYLMHQETVPAATQGGVPRRF